MCRNQNDEFNKASNSPECLTGSAPRPCKAKVKLQRSTPRTSRKPMPAAYTPPCNDVVNKPASSSADFEFWMADPAPRPEHQVPDPHAFHGPLAKTSRRIDAFGSLLLEDARHLNVQVWHGSHDRKRPMTRTVASHNPAGACR